MILAAGLGTRLGKLSEQLPKCLMPIGHTTLLEHVVDRLKAVGVSEVVINLHYLPEQVKTYVREKKNFGIAVNFSLEPNILGTGGGLKQAQGFFGEKDPIIVHNADVYCEFDLSELIKAHSQHQAIATLAIMKRNTERALLFNSNCELVGWDNKGTEKNMILGAGERFGFSGIQIVSPRIFEFMRNEAGSFSIITTYMEAARAGESVRGYDLGGNFWIDAGTPERLEELRTRLKLNDN